MAMAAPSAMITATPQAPATTTITTSTIMIITTPEAARLRLAQYLSPAFPVGGFAWSQGLEWAMDQGAATRATLPGWLGDWLEHGAGWTDAVLVALSLRADADHDALDDLARATCPSAQRLAETVEQGTAFSANASALGQALPAAALPLHRLADRDGSEDEEEIAPHDRRRRAVARDLDLPTNVLRFAPLQGWVAERRDTGRVGSTPLAPEPLSIAVPRLRRHQGR